MSDLTLRVRYFQDSTPIDVPCREENFIRREIEMTLPVASTALVLVDVWNVHFIESWIERAKTVTIEAIVPALRAARTAGLTIIHAPCPEVARQYPQTERNPPVVGAVTPSAEPDWPPAAFRRRAGEYAAYAGPRNQPPSIGIHWNQLSPQLGMSPAIEVREDDVVVATGGQLHRVLAERGILHLIYAGFATNWCVLGRDYGVRAMARHAYNIILLRDCTTGVEFPDTLQNCFVTEVSIREVEQQFGFSASNADFLASCRRATRE
ncbi:MAG: isochorismatase family protein [Candidatus Latescibacteria bacterium]|nr:isochorismatase family protein [Candidatus Latescibacterota bacterium]